MTARTAGVDALAQLRDLHLPAEPSWFPPAPGWWIVAGLLAAAAVFALARCRRARHRSAPFRAAATELARLRADAEAGRTTAADYAHGASAILKRVAIHVLHRPEAAPLSGIEWLRFLDSLHEGDAFCLGAGAALGDGRFTARAAVDHVALDAAVRELLGHLERRANRRRAPVAG